MDKRYLQYAEIAWQNRHGGYWDSPPVGDSAHDVKARRRGEKDDDHMCNYVLDARLECAASPIQRTYTLDAPCLYDQVLAMLPAREKYVIEGATGSPDRIRLALNELREDRKAIMVRRRNGDSYHRYWLPHSALYEHGAYYDESLTDKIDYDADVLALADNTWQRTASFDAGKTTKAASMALNRLRIAGKVESMQCGASKKWRLQTEEVKE